MTLSHDINPILVAPRPVFAFPLPPPSPAPPRSGALPSDALEEFLSILKQLWEDPNVQAAYARGNEAALPEKCVSRRLQLDCAVDTTAYYPRSLNYYFADLDRLFEPSYVPNEQDIVHARARTIGITETVFTLRDHDMLMVDVGGQKSERRKWIHCFQDVTSILFLVSLSGFDQCLVEDKDAVRTLRQRSSALFGADAPSLIRIKCKTR